MGSLIPEKYGSRAQKCGKMKQENFNMWQRICGGYLVLRYKTAAAQNFQSRFGHPRCEFNGAYFCKLCMPAASERLTCMTPAASFCRRCKPGAVSPPASRNDDTTGMLRRSSGSSQRAAQHAPSFAHSHLRDKYCPIPELKYSAYCRCTWGPVQPVMCAEVNTQEYEGPNTWLIRGTECGWTGVRMGVVAELAAASAALDANCGPP